MRISEIKTGRLKPYYIVITLSDSSSAETLIYADTPENAWLIASKQYGSKNIVSITDPNHPKPTKPSAKPGTLQFWRDRLRKYARLATLEPRPLEFADQVDDYLARQDQRSLARIKAEKAKRHLRR